MEIIPTSYTAKYRSDFGAVVIYRIACAVRVSCYLFESIVMMILPMTMSVVAVRSYLGTSRSPRYFVDRYTFNTIAKAEKLENRVILMNGRDTAKPMAPIAISKTEQKPLRVQNTVFEIV